MEEEKEEGKFPPPYPNEHYITYAGRIFDEENQKKYEWKTFLKILKPFYHKHKEELKDQYVKRTYKTKKQEEADLIKQKQIKALLKSFPKNYLINVEEQEELCNNNPLLQSQYPILCEIIQEWKQENPCLQAENRIDPIYQEEFPLEDAVHLRQIHSNYKSTTGLCRNLRTIKEMYEKSIDNSMIKDNNKYNKENEEIIRKPLLDPLTRQMYNNYTIRQAVKLK